VVNCDVIVVKQLLHPFVHLFSYYLARRYCDHASLLVGWFITFVGFLEKYYTVSQKSCANLFFCQNFVKFRPIVKIFGTKIAEKTSFSAVYSFSTSHNLC